MAILELENVEKSFSPGFIPRRRQVLKGVSFAVANVTGCLARLQDGWSPLRVADARQLLESVTAATRSGPGAPRGPLGGS